MQGYLVSLGNGQLNGGDAIRGILNTFNGSATTGTGTWTWSGTTSGGATVTNQVATGTYYLGSDGSVYFVPTTPVGSVTSAQATTTPIYDDNVYGTAGNDSAILGDGNSDVHYGGTTSSGTGTGSDTISAGAGNDTVFGGDGDDLIRGSGDTDSLSGGDGNDTIYGDNQTTVTGGAEDLNWSLQSGSVTGGFTQDTGGMRVTFAYNDDGAGTGAAISNSVQYTAAPETFSTTSGLQLTGNGTGNTSTIGLTFDAEAGSGLSDQVSNVSFRINDIDHSKGNHRDIIVIRAWDLNGNMIIIDLTAAGGDSVVDGTTSAGATITAANGLDDPNLAAGSVLVFIPGPVRYIEIDYGNALDGTQAIWLTDVQFTTLPAADGNDTIDTGAGHDLSYGGGGNDLIATGTGNDTVFGGTGNDALTGGTGNSMLFGGDGNDTLTGGSGSETLHGDAGNDTMTGAGGNDRFVLGNAAGTDTVTGGATTETTGDTLDASGVTTNITLSLSGANPETGTLTSTGINTSFTEIEAIILGSGADEVIGSTGADHVSTGLGADTVNGGAGNDVFDLGGTGSGDNAADLAVMQDGSDDDTIGNFDGPIDNGDGTFTGVDTLDVSNLHDGSGNPVNVADVVVSDDGFGNAVLRFPNGESVTLIGITPAEVSDPRALMAMGIPGTDGTVSGTGGDDIVNGSYTGDPDGDRVDTADGLIFGHGPNDDLIIAGAGNDVVSAGVGNDTVYGGTGRDTLYGGLGNDSLSGDAGNDSITFADGDTARGGEGDDLFTLADLGEPANGTITVVGGEGTETRGDTLQLGTLADWSSLVITTPATVGGGMAGTITLDDGTILNFSEIENIICFTPGTRIATPRGARPVEMLAIGDLVMTRDHGLQPIRWVGQRSVPAIDRFAPVRIRPGVVTGLETDLLVSPQHRMLFQGYRAELLFGCSEVLVAAANLVDGRLVTQDAGGMVTYIHIMFDDHEIIYAEGAATESFHPGSVGLSAVTAAAREELFALFPELRSAPRSYGQTARRVLKSHEGRLIRG